MPVPLERTRGMAAAVTPANPHTPLPPTAACHTPAYPPTDACLLNLHTVTPDSMLPHTFECGRLPLQRMLLPHTFTPHPTSTSICCPPPLFPPVLNSMKAKFLSLFMYTFTTDWPAKHTQQSAARRVNARKRLVATRIPPALPGTQATVCHTDTCPGDGTGAVTSRACTTAGELVSSCRSPGPAVLPPTAARAWLKKVATEPSLAVGGRPPTYTRRAWRVACWEWDVPAVQVMSGHVACALVRGSRRSMCHVSSALVHGSNIQGHVSRSRIYPQVRKQDHRPWPLSSLLPSRPQNTQHSLAADSAPSPLSPPTAAMPAAAMPRGSMPAPRAAPKPAAPRPPRAGRPAMAGTDGSTPGTCRHGASRHRQSRGVCYAEPATHGQAVCSRIGNRLPAGTVHVQGEKSRLMHSFDLARVLPRRQCVQLVLPPCACGSALQAA